MKTKPTNIEDWEKEFTKRYDFSENSTLEYDNLLTIYDFIRSLLSLQKSDLIQKIEEWVNDHSYAGLTKGCVSADDLLSFLKQLDEKNEK